MSRELLPKLAAALPQYTWRKFLADAVAGVTVDLVALPLAMALAISSGVPRQAGLYCAVVAGFLISARCPLAQYIPLPVLSAILFVVAYNMGEWKENPKLLKMSWASIAI